jgi:DNA invertase Pin-like site-specific DNA recombinase
VKQKIRFIAIKESISFDGKQDLKTKVMIALFGLFAEVERDLISERTKEGLAAARQKGKLLVRRVLRSVRHPLFLGLEKLPDFVICQAGSNRNRCRIKSRSGQVYRFQD